VEKLSRIGMDTSKRIFQLHGVDGAEQPVLRKTLPRDRMMAFFQALPPAEVALEACGALHHWARMLGEMGHTAKLIAPQLAKPYVKRGKNDAADAEALCEAASRPTMRYVPVKTVDQQAALMLAASRERLVHARTQLGNAIRGHATEFGLIAAKGASHVAALLAQVQADTAIPAVARGVFAGLSADHAHVEARLAAVDAEMRAWHKASAVAQRLTQIPGVGPVIASMLVMKTPNPHAFRSGRDFAAWLGLTPKDHSTAGKTRLGRITRAGDETLRSLLVVGATSVIRHASIGNGRYKSAWLLALLARKPPKLAAVALANKTARIAWRLMASGEAYDITRAQPNAQPKLAAA
jgi:transposase